MTGQPHASIKLYLAIWGWLAGLMLLGVLLSLLPISKMTVVLIVLGLSSIKAFLVALYYMHLKFDRRILALIMLFPFVLIGLALTVLLSSHFVRI